MNVRKLYFDRLNRKLNAIEDSIRLIKRAQGADQKDPWKILDGYLQQHEMKVRDLLDRVQKTFGPDDAKRFQQLLENSGIKPDTSLSSDLVRNILNIIRSKPEYRRALDAAPAIVDALLKDMPKNERKIVTNAVKAHISAPQTRQPAQQPAQQNAAQPSPQAQQTQKARERLVPVQLSPDGKGGVYHDPETGDYWALFPDGRKVWVSPDEMAKTINAREMSKNRPWFQQIMSNPHYTDRSKVLEDQGMTEDAERMFKFHLQQFAPRSFDPNRTALLRARAAEFAEVRDGKKVITGNSVKAAIVADYLIQRGRGLAHEDEVFRNPATAGWPTNMPPRTKEQQAKRIAESVTSSVERFEDIRNTLLGLSPELRLRVWSSLPKETRQQLLKAYRDLDSKTFGRGYIEERWKRIKSDIVKWGIIPVPPEQKPPEGPPPEQKQPPVPPPNPFDEPQPEQKQPPVPPPEQKQPPVPPPEQKQPPVPPPEQKQPPVPPPPADQSYALTYPFAPREPGTIGSVGEQITVPPSLLSGWPESNKPAFPNYPYRVVESNPTEGLGLPNALTQPQKPLSQIFESTLGPLPPPSNKPTVPNYPYRVVESNPTEGLGLPNALTQPQKPLSQIFESTLGPLPSESKKTPAPTYPFASQTPGTIGSVGEQITVPPSLLSGRPASNAGPSGLPAAGRPSIPTYPYSPLESSPPGTIGRPSVIPPALPLIY